MVGEVPEVDIGLRGLLGFFIKEAILRRVSSIHFEEVFHGAVRGHGSVKATCPARVLHQVFP